MTSDLTTLHFFFLIQLENTEQSRLKCLGLASLQRTICRIRSRITWLKDGIASAKFFRIQASHMQKKHAITKLKTEQGLLTAPIDVENALFQHFENIMGTEVERTQTVNLTV